MDENHIKINIDLNSDDINKILNECDDDCDFVDDVDEDDAAQLKRRILFCSVLKLTFFMMFMGSVFIFPYEIIMDKTFGLGKAFLLVFWGLTCIVFGSGVAKRQIKHKRRLKELSAEVPKAS